MKVNLISTVLISLMTMLLTVEKWSEHRNGCRVSHCIVGISFYCQLVCVNYAAMTLICDACYIKFTILQNNEELPEQGKQSCAAVSPLASLYVPAGHGNCVSTCVPF